MNSERGRSLPWSPLKAAWRELVDALGGGKAVERSQITRCGDSLFSQYGAVHASAFAPVDIMLDVEAAVVAAGGEPAFLRAYADALGFAVIRNDAIANPLPVLDHAAIRAIGVLSELSGAVYEAAKDGVITPDESHDLAAQGQRAGHVVTEFTEAARSRARKGAA